MKLMMTVTSSWQRVGEGGVEHTVPHHTHNIQFICLHCLSLCHHNLILNQNNTFVVKSKHAHIIAVILQLNYTLQGGNGTNLHQLADLSFAVQSVAEGSSVLQARRTSDTRQTTVTHCESAWEQNIRSNMFASLYFTAHPHHWVWFGPRQNPERRIQTSVHSGS